MTLKEQLSASHRQEMIFFDANCKAAAGIIMDEFIKKHFVKLHEENKCHKVLKFGADTTGSETFKVCGEELKYKQFGLGEELTQEMKNILWNYIFEMARKEGIEVTPYHDGTYLLMMDLSES